MNHIFTTILFILFTSWGYAQTDTNKTDAKRQKQGYWRKTDDKGVVKYEGNFKNDIPVGEFIHYTPEGKVSSHLFYFQSGQKAFSKNYYENGALMSTGYYHLKQKDSIWKYYSEDSVLLKQESYKNNHKHGLWLLYAHDTIVESQTWNFGKLHGSFFIKTNQYSVFCTYKNDLRDGVYKETWNSGKPKASGKYTQGKQDDIWAYYNENGAVRKTEKWKSGVLVESIIYLPIQGLVKKVQEKEIAYFFNRSVNKTIVMLKSGEKITADMPNMDLFDLVDPMDFFQVNGEIRLITRLSSIKETIREDKIYRLIFNPDLGADIYSDEKGAKIIDSMRNISKP